MANHLLALIRDYIETLPEWQKVLAVLALDLDRPIQESEPEIELSRHLFKASISLETHSDRAKETLLKLNLPQANKKESETLSSHLIKLANLKNVNALAEDQYIEFAPKLTIIYGDNGSGKSGYSRLLNSAFYSRGDKKIIPDVLKPADQHGTAEADFEFSYEGATTSLKYPTDKSHPYFEQFACFDSHTAIVHLEGTNELLALPNEFEVLRRLAELVALTIQSITKEAQTESANSMKLLAALIHSFEGHSEIKEMLININPATKIEEIKKYCTTEENTKEILSRHEKEFLEHKHTDPKKKAEELFIVKKELESFSIYINNCKNQVFNVQNRTQMESDCTALRKLKFDSNRSGLSTFKNQFYATTGSQEWKLFILSANKFIISENASAGEEPRSVGKQCPLCLQDLSDSAVDLFNRYFSFLEGSTETRIKDLEGAIKAHIDRINHATIPTFNAFLNLYSWLSANLPSEKGNLESLVTTLAEERKSTLDRLEEFNFSAQTNRSIDDIDELLKNMNVALEASKSQLNETTFRKALLDCENKYIFAKHKHALFENIEEISSHILNYQNASAAKTEASKLNTRSITEKQKKIFEEYFNKRYKQLFFQEARHLNVNFNIDVKPKGISGKAGRKLEVLNFSPEQILSEGEQRAIALADFLTEVEICDIRGGMVFDDPVNSMDHERKAYIASRLVRESLKRQVVILTHDLSFLHDLMNECERHALKEHTDFFCHIVYKVGHKIGLVNRHKRKDLERDFYSPARADDLLRAAKAIEDDILKREDLVKQGFDSLRCCYEAFILTELFSKTVSRFDRQIKYATLKKVYCPRSYLDKIYDRLGFCSGFVNAHLHPDSYSGVAPTTELLQTEIDTFNRLRIDFTSERNKELKKIDYLFERILDVASRQVS